MKKLAIMATMVLGTYYAGAQNYMDAARISERVNSGDARYTSMGGAFSSLGGNFASVSDNPASTGVFESGMVEFSLGNNFSTTETSFLDQSQRGRNTNLSFNNFGVVGKIELPKNDLDAKYINLSYSINRVNDYNANYNMEAYNESSSMTDNFLSDIESNGLDNASYLSQDAWETYVVDYDSTTSHYFTDFIKWANGSLERGPYGITQAENISTSGRQFENSFSIGTNFNNVVYLGGSIDVGRYTYEEIDEYTESDDDDNISYFDNFTLARKLNQTGRGVNLKTGIIVKPNKMFRLGLSYHFPRYWYISEDYSSYTTANYDNGNSYTSPSNGNGEYQYDYNMTTPGRVVAGASVIIKKSVIISCGYEYMNYANAIFESDDYSFTETNKEIEEELRGAGTLRLGTEVRMGPLSVRGGAAIYQSPYTYYSSNFGDYRSTYSGGIGFRNDNFYMDLAIAYSTTPSFRHLYSDYYGNDQVSTTDTKETQALMTFGLKF